MFSKAKKTIISIIISILIFGIYTTISSNALSLSNLSNNQNDPILEFTREELKDIIPDEARMELLKTVKRFDKSKSENIFLITYVKNQEDFISVSMTTGSVEKNKQKHKELEEGQGQEIIRFNIYMLKKNNTWKGVIDSEVDENSDFVKDIPQEIIDNNTKDILFKKEKNSLSKLFNIEVLAQEFTDYKFPWIAGESMKVTQGWHSTSDSVFPVNTAIDLAPITPETNINIIASAPGIIDYMCVGDNNQTYIRVKRVNGSNIERIAYLHVDYSTIDTGAISTNESITEIGDLIEGFVSDACGNSAGTHIHLVFPSQSFEIDGVLFNSGNSHFDENLTSSNGGGCVPPSNGNWNVTASCDFTGSHSAPADVVIDNNSTLRIKPGANLNINMTSNKLVAKSGSSVIIENGGKVY